MEAEAKEILETQLEFLRKAQEKALEAGDFSSVVTLSAQVVAIAATIGAM
ncbi:MAG: hypothetical protein IJ446_08975 [Oscillospiraceae bacterium]|nr:hypothetical protein [Oscillospiraceae bacterium]